MNKKNNATWRYRLIRTPDNAPFADWLHDRGSLTTRLQTKGTFAVQLIRQGLARPTKDEAIALGIQRKQLAWVREVALLCDDIPLVFAHSVLAYRPRGPLTRWLAQLGNQSLGAKLFSHPGFTRGEIGSQRLDRRHTLFAPALHAMQLAASPPAGLWARRSFFAFGAQSVLITEIFSPALCLKTHQQRNLD